MGTRIVPFVIARCVECKATRKVYANEILKPEPGAMADMPTCLTCAGIMVAEHAGAERQ